MSRLDIVIFGATGYTGKYAVEEMVKLSHKYPEITWGVAGRSQKKLQDLLEEVSLKTDENIMSIKIIIAEITDDKSLKAMCDQAKVIANCCGPYYTVGEPVVRAAIASKTHYVDVAAEPLFMESMQLKYDKEARDAGVYIISACGFYSIPNDMGVLFLEENFRVRNVCFQPRLRGPSFMTRRRVLLKGPFFVIEHGVVKGLNYLLKNGILIYLSIHKRDNKYCANFTNPDESVVHRTQRHLHAVEQKRPVQFKCYKKYDTLLTAISEVVKRTIFNFLTRFWLFSCMLLKYPHWISSGGITEEGPTENVMDSMTLQVDLYGEGWTGAEEGKPNKKIAAKVSCINPYRASVVAQNIAALTILKDIDKMPPRCGVLTPGSAFKKTDLIKRLNESDMKFEIIKISQT
ncbi:hypothetical protein K1T71_006883 [Dendrolimus kikuchii]|uniref:Uncharacterized protein n=1 Tax=Dendrolimus kikuchii TaxID=765133 RepID=A0ACC1D2N2_9NEOP|nr:hypothetical protein K1T71_006883 [Dendrolimus kikuchii]